MFIKQCPIRQYSDNWHTQWFKSQFWKQKPNKAPNFSTSCVNDTTAFILYRIHKPIFLPVKVFLETMKHHLFSWPKKKIIFHHVIWSKYWETKHNSHIATPALWCCHHKTTFMKFTLLSLHTRCNTLIKHNKKKTLLNAQNEGELLDILLVHNFITLSAKFTFLSTAVKWFT